MTMLLLLADFNWDAAREGALRGALIGGGIGLVVGLIVWATRRKG